MHPRRDARPAPDRPGFGLTWVETYLGHYLTARPSTLHDDLAADLAKLHTSRGTRRCYIAPRGGAKTTWLSKAYPLFCAVEGVEPLTLLLAETSGQAETYLAAVKRELEFNPALAASYPGACGVGPVWRTDKITLRNGCSVVARGAGGRILGLTEGAARPTLVVGDDLNQRADAYSPTLRRRKTDWFMRDVLNVGEPRTNYLAAGTPIHREAVVCELDRNGGWQTRRYRSVLRWPDNLDLWDEWGRVAFNLADPDRLANARAFYEDRRAEMDAGAVVLWPDREDLYSLMLKRAEIGPAAFNSEKQDTPGTDGAAEWPAEYFDWPGLWFEDWPRAWVCKVVSLDPSKGVESKPGDYQAHVKVGLGRDGILYVDAELRREPVTEMVRRSFALAKGWGPVNSLYIEDNGTMGFLKPEAERAEKELGTKLPWETATHTRPKRLRLLAAGPYLARRQVRVRNTPGGRMLVEQWRDVPTGEFDDGPDAAGSGIRRLEELVNGTP